MTTAKRKQKRVPPSRVRYEAANPAVTARISQELKEELVELKLMSGLSLADIIKAGLDKLQPDTERSYEKGLADGYDIAKVEFEVLATCSLCGSTHLTVTGEKMKAAVAQKVIGWFSKSCQSSGGTASA